MSVMKRKTYYNIDTFPYVMRLLTEPERKMVLHFWVGFCLTTNSPEKPDRYKRSSLLQTFANDKRKKFYNIGH